MVNRKGTGGRERTRIPEEQRGRQNLPNGYIFRLGNGHEVELVFLGGHSAGSCGFLDKKNRIFFAGDDIISMNVVIHGAKPGVPHGEYATVTTLRDNLRKLAARMDEFDYVFPGHFVTALENVSVRHMLDACEAVCAAPEGNATFRKEKDAGTEYFRYVDGLGFLMYTLKSV